MKVLVTGSPGWLGTRLTEVLTEKSRDVRCLVLPDVDSSYLEKLSAEIFRGDLTDAENIRGCCKGVKTVFHCAGVVHPKKINEFYSINYNGTKNLVNEAATSGIDRFIYVSSNSPAGVNVSRKILMKEDDSPRPYKHYGLSKYKAEEFIKEAFKEGKIKGTIIRPCWFYGIRQPERQTRFFNMIKKGKPILFGNGRNLRSMSYIDNIIEALILAEEKEIALGQTYWIADERPYATLEIYETIAGLLDVKEFRPKFLPKIVSTMCEMVDTILQAFGFYIKEIHVAGEMDKDIACSIEKARKELGYNPKIDLKEGMRRSIEWCRTNGINI